MEYKITLFLSYGETVVTSYPMGKYEQMIQLVLSYVADNKPYKFEVITS